MAATWIEIKGRKYKVELGAESGVQVGGVSYAVSLRETEPGVLSLLWTRADGRTLSFRCIAGEDIDGPTISLNDEVFPYTVSDPRSLRSVSASAQESGPKPLKAPMPGRVIRVLVQAGDTVAAGQGCIVIEAMKMQNELKAPKAGVVRKLAAVVDQTVDAGAVLLVVD